MKRYNDYKTHPERVILTKDELEKVEWTKYIIIVPTEEDRKELMEAFEHIHYSDIDTENIAVNQLAHEYLDNTRVDGASNNIIVHPNLYEKLKKKNNERTTKDTDSRN